MAKTSRKNITTVNNIDLELYIATEILKLNSLHYGYWTSNKELTISGLRKAQADYTEKLCWYIPNTVKTILDVGSGIGDNDKYLASKGFLVTAISPDKNHAKYYNGTNITFKNIAFEELETDQKFDLILMSESQNYFDHTLGFKKCNGLLKTDGYLLVSGKFRKTNSKEFAEVPSTYTEYIKMANANNLHLIKEEDITNNVIPTIAIAQNLYEQYLPKVTELTKMYLKHNKTARATCLRLVFKVILKLFSKRITSLKSFYLQHINPDLFKEFLYYKILLFQYRPSR